MTQWIYLMLAGAVGSAFRYACSLAAMRMGTASAYATVFVNLLGCFLIGFLVTVFNSKAGVSKELQTALIVGFLGALTTFSTFIYELAEMARLGQHGLALGYVLLSVSAGVLIFQWGVAVGKMVF